MGCPACAAQGGAVALEAAKVSGTSIEIDRCPKCSGAFLDSGEMQELRRAKRPTRRPPPAPKLGR